MSVGTIMFPFNARHFLLVYSVATLGRHAVMSLGPHFCLVRSFVRSFVRALPPLELSLPNSALTACLLRTTHYGKTDGHGRAGERSNCTYASCDSGGHTIKGRARSKSAHLLHILHTHTWYIL